MPDFTPGKWWIAPPMFDGDVIYAPPTEKGRTADVVAMGILNNADARLIAEAPNMYRLLTVFCRNSPTGEDSFDDLLMAMFESRKLIARIDGKEGRA